MGFWDLGLSDFAGSALNLVGTLATNNAQKDIANANNAAQAEREQAAREWNEDMWNKNNEYNSPVEQMKRLQEAGINPQLVGGTPQLAGNSASPAAGVQPNPLSMPMLHNPDLASPLMQRLQQKINLRSVQNQEAETNIKQGQLDVEKYKADSFVKYNNARVDYLAKQGVFTDEQVENLKKTRELLAAQTSQAIQSANLLSTENAIKTIDLHYAEDRNKLELSKLRKECNLLDAEAKELEEAAKELITRADVNRRTVKIKDVEYEMVKTDYDFIQLESTFVNGYFEDHVKSEAGTRQLMYEQYLNKYSAGVNQALQNEVQRMNAHTNAKNAATNRSNAKTKRYDQWSRMFDTDLR